MNSHNLPPPPPPSSQSHEQPTLRSQYAPPGQASNGLNGSNNNSYSLNGAMANLSLGNAGNNFSHQGIQNQNNNTMAAAAATANGLMGNRAQWPSTGDQMDMQVLWELINNIADVQQGIREQTSGVLQRVQLVQAREGEESSEAPVTNGISTSESAASISHAKEQAYLDEISSLRSQLSNTTTQLTTLTSQHQSLATLLQHHESSLGMVLTRLRPYATQHTQALESQKAHYLSLLEQERSQNLDLRLEVSRLQDGLGKVLGMVRAAEQDDIGKERRWTRRIAGVKAENRVLKNVCGLPVEAESSESESEDEDEWIAGIMDTGSKASTSTGSGGASAAGIKRS